MLNWNSWDRLTTEQKELAFTIERKWLTVARCTERIDRTSATEAINAVYLAVGLRKVPKIIFVDSPAAIDIEIQRDKYTGQLSPNIKRFLRMALFIRARENIPYDSINLTQPSTQQHDLDDSSDIFSGDQMKLLHKVSIQFWSFNAWFLDFAYSVLGCDNYVPEKWEALQLLVTSCGFILPFQFICFVSDRPTEMLFKDDFILHAENRPAVVFSDGYQIFAENGVELSTTD
jgi:hypothetical protein